MRVALIGPMQSGKSTLLSAISGKAPALPGTSKIEEAVVPVPDTRIDWLDGVYHPKKKVYATVDCFDVPGFSFLDDAGRAAANRLISDIRKVDMFVLVVRAFEESAVPPYRGTIDPARDITELHSEFLLADMQLASSRIAKLEVEAKKPSKTQQQDKEELELQRRLLAALEEEKPLSALGLSEQELKIIRSLGFLTLKPAMVVVNIGEGDLEKQFDFGGVIDEAVPVVTLSAKLERELQQLDEESRREFMADLGLTESAAQKFVASCYTALGLISFLTVGPDEVRAWPIRQGLNALEAAGKIHSDIKRGFIRAETMPYADLRELGDEKAVKAAGKKRLEGKEYLVQDGDIIEFRFNV